MLSEPEPLALISATHDALSEELGHLERNIPDEMARALDENIFLFSGFKTYHEMNDASRLLKDEDGGFKPFDRFLQDVQAIDATYNQNWLYAEYNFATASTQMAAKWADIERDGDEYDLQYRTALDGLVRPEHAALEGITLPPSDKFWNEYYPPNGWNCRCTAVQVLKDKYPTSDSDQACAAGERATTQIGKNGENKAAMFRFNPGKAGKVFPPKHPYYKAPAEVKKQAENLAKTQSSPLGTQAITDDKTLSAAIDGLKSDWFKQGFKEIKAETNPLWNGSTDFRGTINLTAEIRQKCISGLEKMRSGKECTKDEEKAMATLWHEITHNRHDLSKDIPGKLSDTERKYMETANEFVARKSLPEFYGKAGGSMKHPEFMSDRDNTRYNDWVVKYQKAIADHGLNEAKVIETVKKGLFDGDLHHQKDNLVKGLMEGSKTVDNNGKEKYGLTKAQATRIVEQMLNN